MRTCSPGANFTPPAPDRSALFLFATTRALLVFIWPSWSAESRVGESAVRGRGVNVRFRYSAVRFGRKAGGVDSGAARRGGGAGRQAEAAAAFSRFFFLPPAPAWPFCAFGSFSFISPF